MTLTAKAAINCDQVYAMVVGIETYELGADYDLDGPAQDGLNFINWLLSRGVLPGNIRFFVSPLAKNADVELQAKKLGISTSSATREQIDRYIRDELITEQAKGEGLYVFWGGHGVLSKTHDTDRRLLFADTTEANKLNLLIKTLVQGLSTSAHGAGFHRQIFLVDACANSYFQGLYETVQAEAAGQRYSAMNEQMKAEQSVLFAVAEYEVAKNSLGAGLFSAAVLAELQEQPLWPDMKALAERVQADFKRQNESEPDYLWVKRGGWEEVIDNFRYEKMRAPVSGVTSSKEKRLIQEIGLLEEKLNRCFEKRLLTDDPDRQVTLEKLEEKLERDIANKKRELENES
jgi:hypothetical protein